MRQKGEAITRRSFFPGQMRKPSYTEEGPLCLYGETAMGEESILEASWGSASHLPHLSDSSTRRVQLPGNWLSRGPFPPWGCCAVLSRSVMSNSLWPHGLQSARLLCSWDSPGKNTGVGSHFLLQGIFKKIRDTKGTFHAKMSTIKDRNSMDLTEAEDTKKRWQEYTEVY